ncbi:unnamed protein product [Eruca vesicaria subsp. sativa]|uniref:Wax synthase domain-containing protein n=1 Tax=Eruca vesicaria subsp. sativa TaxID=29727 RepID=A0ABC8LEE0_ERUVS|nr:unnamed protein product [Eruca vesicaria subsp. sativa]
MEEELKNFIKVWVLAIISISYCYYSSTKIKPGVFRLLSVLPVCALFLVLPLFFSSVHLSGIIAFFISFLANFKLILFSFNQGPLVPTPPSLTLFICFTCFPSNNTRENPKYKNHLPKWVFAFKLVIFDGLLYVYYQYYKTIPHPFVLWCLHSLHIYLEIEIVLMIVKVAVSIIFGCDLEPHCNEPYLATSLQDFWGRRWNLMVPEILRQAVYTPICGVVSKRKLNSELSLFLGFLVTFVVSGAVHELMLFYLTRELRTGEVTMFFVLHGVCTAAEVVVEKKFARRLWRMSTVLSRLLTVGFVVVTGGLWFFPRLIRKGMIEGLANEVLFVNNLTGLIRSGFLIDLS